MTPMFHQALVLSRRQISPGLLRLTFGGAGLGDFVTTGIGDEYIRLFFPNPDTGRLHLPHIDNGRWTYPDGGLDRIKCASYTIRRFVPGQIEVDFVLHEHGLASDWARRAAPGDTVTINNPRGLYTPPSDIAWQLLVADATGLPAVSRILEQTPGHVQSRIFLEVAAPEHQIDLPEHPGATVTWMPRSGNGVAPSRLNEVVRSVTMPATPGYVWAAGEQRVVRAIRKFLRQDLRLPPERYQLVGYWTAAAEQWDATWQAIDPAIRARIDAAWQSGQDAEAVRDDYEATLEQFGL